jgi:hypothetical protein
MTWPDEPHEQARYHAMEHEIARRVFDELRSTIVESFRLRPCAETPRNSSTKPGNPAILLEKDGGQEDVHRPRSPLSTSFAILTKGTSKSFPTLPYGQGHKEARSRLTQATEEHMHEHREGVRQRLASYGSA